MALLNFLPIEPWTEVAPVLFELVANDEMNQLAVSGWSNKTYHVFCLEAIEEGGRAGCVLREMPQSPAWYRVACNAGHECRQEPFVDDVGVDEKEVGKLCVWVVKKTLPAIELFVVRVFYFPSL